MKSQNRLSRLFFWFAALLLLVLVSGCGAEKTPDPIRSLLHATQDVDREVLFEATKSVWVQYNVNREELPATGEPDSQGNVRPSLSPADLFGALTAGTMAVPSPEDGTDGIQPVDPNEIANPDNVVKNGDGESPAISSEPVPGADGGFSGFYTLQEGETPKCIARRYNLDWRSLYSKNGINFENEATIGAGKTLFIPQNTVWMSEQYGERASAPHPADHPVVAGETLYSIACVYGDVSPEAIAIQNGLTSPDQVVPGMVLRIP